jgi:hypothetical protein
MQTGASAADDLVLREFSQQGRACGTAGKPVNSSVISTPRTVAMANARPAEIAWRECPAWVERQEYRPELARVSAHAGWSRLQLVRSGQSASGRVAV